MSEGRNMRFRIFLRPLKTIFPDSEPEVSPILARMSVLYEDLRIEYQGAYTARDKIPELDIIDPIYRKFYFLRRSTVTLLEFAGALHYLRQRPEFNVIREKFSAKELTTWNDAVQFFEKGSDRYEYLKKLRHEFGGRFQLSTIRSVLDRMDLDAIGVLEIAFDDPGKHNGPRLRYVFEFIARVIFKDRPNPEDNDQELVRAWARNVFDTITDGWKHAVDVMGLLVRHEVYARFRRY